MVVILSLQVGVRILIFPLLLMAGMPNFKYSFTQDIERKSRKQKEGSQLPSVGRVGFSGSYLNG